MQRPADRILDETPREVCNEWTDCPYRDNAKVLGKLGPRLWRQKEDHQGERQTVDQENCQEIQEEEIAARTVPFPV